MGIPVRHAPEVEDQEFSADGVREPAVRGQLVQRQATLLLRVAPKRRPDTLLGMDHREAQPGCLQIVLHLVQGRIPGA
jgi:hypothetical protein